MTAIVNRFVSASVALVALLTLSACAGSVVGIQTKTLKGLPEASDVAGGVVEADFSSPLVLLSTDRESLVVVTFGSSSCRAVPTSIAESEGTLVLDFGATGGPFCTSDMAATTAWVTIPDGFATDRAFTVDLDGDTFVVEP